MAVDPQRIALWGTSFSGGHVVPVAAGDGGVAAVVSQVPYGATGRAPGRPRPGFLARMIGAAVLDELRGRLGRSPHYIPVVGKPEEFAAFNRPAAGARALELRRYAAGHFDVYVGEWFERTVADQVEFLTRHLLR